MVTIKPSTRRFLISVDLAERTMVGLPKKSQLAAISQDCSFFVHPWWYDFHANDDDDDDDFHADDDNSNYSYGDTTTTSTTTVTTTMMMMTT